MSEYEKQLEEWKSKHGLDGKADAQDEMRMMAEDAKNPKRSWCFGCDKHMRIQEMKIITKAIDPYKQLHEGEGDYIPLSERVRMCPECFEQEYGKH